MIDTSTAYPTVVQSTIDPHRDVREVLSNFLKRSMANDERSPARQHQNDDHLYQSLLNESTALFQKAGDDIAFADKFSRTACDLAHIIYGHTGPEHQYYIALYTVCYLYADDLGSRHVDALAQFSRRFGTGEKQLNPVLERLAELMRESHNLWPQVGADAIISGSLEAISAMFIECTCGDMEITPKATWWPNYFRNRTGICPPYAHFNFMKSWRSVPESYLQLLPYLEFYIVAGNDVLSFYKEELVGEKKNYIYIRATTDQKTPIDMLRLVADEVVACGERVELLTGDDPELMEIWRSFQQGVLEFHIKTQRYQLAELIL